MYVDVPPPRPVDVMSAPGASRSSAGPLFEKHATVSAAVAAWLQPRPEKAPKELSKTAPTATTALMHAGAPSCVADPLFIDDAKTVTPCARSVATTDAYA